MTISRRGFLGALLAASVAPAIVRADNLMKLAVPRRLVLWGDGEHDDTDAAQALIDRSRDVYSPAGVLLPAGVLAGGVITISRTLKLASNLRISGCEIRASAPMECLLHVKAPVRNLTIESTAFFSHPQQHSQQRIFF